MANRRVASGTATTPAPARFRGIATSGFLTTSKLIIFDVRPRGGSSHPIFSSRPGGSALLEFQKSDRFPAKPGVIRGMSVYAFVDKNRSPLLVGGLPIQWPN